MFGLGTIGLAVIDALREVGAKIIIGVDMDEGKFERAKTWGATHLLNPSQLKGSVVVSHPPCLLAIFANSAALLFITHILMQSFAITSEVTHGCFSCSWQSDGQYVQMSKLHNSILLISVLH